VVINFLPAERTYKSDGQVPFPVRQEVRDQPQFVSLEQLIALKLDSWVHSPNRRLKDKADVIELIIILKLPRDLSIAESGSPSLCGNLGWAGRGKVKSFRSRQAPVARSK